MSVQLTSDQVGAEIAECESGLDGRSLRLWERMRIAPLLWRQDQYPGETPFWVVAVLGYRCLYFNYVEGGWGWGRFTEWGRVSEYHCQQDELLHTVEQTLFAIDHGGAG